MTTQTLNEQAFKFSANLDNLNKQKSDKNKKRELERILSRELTYGKSKIGITKKNKSSSKKKIKIAKLSAKKNRVKTRHHWTTKEKKSR